MGRKLSDIDTLIARIRELNDQHVQVRRLLEDFITLRRKATDLDDKHAEYEKRHKEYLEERHSLSRRAREVIGGYHEFIKDMDTQFLDAKDDVIDMDDERVKKIGELKKIATEQAAKIYSLEDKADRIESIMKKIYTVGLISIVFLGLIAVALSIVVFFTTF